MTGAMASGAMTGAVVSVVSGAMTGAGVSVVSGAMVSRPCLGCFARSHRDPQTERSDVRRGGLKCSTLPPSCVAGQLVFVDDRAVNVDAANAAGLDGILFLGAQDLEARLAERGIQL